MIPPRHKEIRNKHTRELAARGTISVRFFGTKFQKRLYCSSICCVPRYGVRPKGNCSSSLLGGVRTAPFPIVVRGTVLHPLQAT